MKIPKVIIINDVTDNEDTVQIHERDLVEVVSTAGFLIPRNGKNLNKKSFYLSETYDWRLVKDSGGQICLLPTKKRD